MTDQITLTPYLRALLLKEICSRIDIVEYYEFLLNAPLTKSIRNTFTGTCPFCSDAKAFIIDKESGEYLCAACGQTGDFLTLVGKKHNLSVNSSLQVVTGYLGTAEEKRMKSRYTAEVLA
jgi:DNA primase